MSSNYFDTFGRKISYLRISVTDRCNLRCHYCMPAEGLPLISHDKILTFEQITRFTEVAVSMGISKVRLTGGEPLVRRGFGTLITMLGQIQGIEELVLTTNGIFLGKYVSELLSAGVKRVNVSLDTLNPDKYSEITRGGNIQTVLDSIETALSSGLKIKINQVVSSFLNEEDILELDQWVAEKGISIQRIRQFSPDQHKVNQHHSGVKDDYLKSIYKKPFDRPYPCSECNRIRLMADGQIKPCLHSKKSVQVDFTDIQGSILKAVQIKPQSGSCSDLSSLSQIGG